MRLSNEEINKIAIKYLKLKNEADQSEEKKSEFAEFQNYCMTELGFLVERRAAKYKKFSNYIDLKQDGFEAMLLAFKTYNSKKGNFSWWADKYIKTRISRCANAHSTIRYPIKKAAVEKPHKVSIIPNMIEEGPDGFDSFQESENKMAISKIIDELPDEQKLIVKKMYGFIGKKPASMASIMEEMSMSRPHFLKVLKEAQDKIKRALSIED